MKNLTLGVIGTSRKEDEKRVPIHPDHLSRLPENIRKQLIFEKGYGASFGISDDFLVSRTGGVASRHELLTEVGSVIIAKPMLHIDTVDYYAVDHTPSYLWESASRSLSAALIVYLPTFWEARKAG